MKKNVLRKALEGIKSNERQLLEVLFLILVAAIPYLFNLSELFAKYLENIIVSPDNILEYTVITHRKCVSSLILLLIATYLVRKFNGEFVMNNRIITYQNYPYLWYWFCAKILGIKKCNLVKVPIYIQFMLIIRGTFDEYPLNENDYPIIDNEPDCRVIKTNTESDSKEINLILEDTFLVSERLIPRNKRSCITIKISRNDGEDKGRHFSEQFIATTINTIRSINRIQRLNIYATTNPMNTKHLASRVFALGDRGNIEHLYVFQQDDKGLRSFKPKGHKIY